MPDIYDNLAIVFSSLAVFFGVIKWVSTKNENTLRRMHESDQEVLVVAQRAHSRLDELPKEYVRREELLAHLRTVEARIEGLAKNIDGVSSSVEKVSVDANSKLSALQDTLTKILQNMTCK